MEWNDGADLPRMQSNSSAEVRMIRLSKSTAG